MFSIQDGSFNYFHQINARMWSQVKILIYLCFYSNKRAFFGLSRRDKIVGAICFDKNPASSVCSSCVPCSMYLSESTIDLHCRKASRENSSRNEIMGRVNHLHKGTFTFRDPSRIPYMLRYIETCDPKPPIEPFSTVMGNLCSLANCLMRSVSKGLQNLSSETCHRNVTISQNSNHVIFYHNSSISYLHNQIFTI
ncbi:PREDICTED: uncharacterized protein LOC109334953 [Lupinus angustifolius]|uniref:uncharacterized protein LOC109334953 n=1 Tax=Lupinus angustifolius TaxID=3871 RepID=UPI00092F788C|nr:PREDICTED: uncharacterized protein LOC109334953 [Lupinus angustifolius]